MKRLSLLMLALLVLIGGVPATVFALSETYKYQDQSLFATFSFRDGDLKTVTTVIASKRKTSGPGPNSEPMILVATSTYDTKKKKLRWDSFGVTDKYDQFSVNNQLNKGNLRATVDVYDSVKDDNYKLKVDLSWSEDGKRKNNVDRTYTVKPPANVTDIIKLNGSFTGDERPADVSGTVKKGGKDWAENLQDGYIQDLDEGVVNVTRPDEN